MIRLVNDYCSLFLTPVNVRDQVDLEWKFSHFRRQMFELESSFTQLIRRMMKFINDKFIDQQKLQRPPSTKSLFDCLRATQIEDISQRLIMRKLKFATHSSAIEDDANGQFELKACVVHSQPWTTNFRGHHVFVMQSSQQFCIRNVALRLRLGFLGRWFCVPWSRWC